MTNNKTAAAIRANWQTADSVVVELSNGGAMALPIEDVKAQVTTGHRYAPIVSVSDPEGNESQRVQSIRYREGFDLVAEIDRAELAAEAKRLMEDRFGQLRIDSSHDPDRIVQDDFDEWLEVVTKEART